LTVLHLAIPRRRAARAAPPLVHLTCREKLTAKWPNTDNRSNVDEAIPASEYHLLPILIYFSWHIRCPKGY